MPAEERNYPPSVSKLSKTPSWIMLGFVLGALFVLTLPRKSSAPVAPPRVERPAAPVAPTPLTVEHAIYFESIFAELGQSAIWQDDVTEVAFWNSERRDFSDCFEVLRMGDKFYFRSIPRLTRPVPTEGVGPDSPFRFTVPVGAKIPRAPLVLEQPMGPGETVYTFPVPKPFAAPPVPPPEMPPINVPPAGKK